MVFLVLREIKGTLVFQGQSVLKVSQVKAVALETEVELVQLAQLVSVALKAIKVNPENLVLSKPFINLPHHHHLLNFFQDHQDLRDPLDVQVTTECQEPQVKALLESQVLLASQSADLQDHLVHLVHPETVKLLNRAVVVAIAMLTPILCLVQCQLCHPVSSFFDEITALLLKI